MMRSFVSRYMSLQQNDSVVIMLVCERDCIARLLDERDENIF